MMNFIGRAALAGLALAFAASGVGVLIVAWFAMHSFWGHGWRVWDALLIVAVLGSLPVAQESFRNAAEMLSWRSELRADYEARLGLPQARARKRQQRPVIP